MRDVIFLLVMVGFFALAAGVVRLCERVIGPDDRAPSASEAPTATAVPSAATTAAVER